MAIRQKLLILGRAIYIIYGAQWKMKMQGQGSKMIKIFKTETVEH